MTVTTTETSSKEFRSRRLTARACRPGDAKSLAALMTPDISRWLAAWPYPLTQDHASEIIQDCLAAADRGEVMPTIIVEQSSNRVIGWLKLSRSSKTHTEFELSYWIAEAFQRKGYAFEIASAAIEFAQKELAAQRIIAGAQIENEASHALLSKLGMHPTHETLVWAPARQRQEMCRFWQFDTSA